jgi:hypothetical protein
MRRLWLLAVLTLVAGIVGCTETTPVTISGTTIAYAIRDDSRRSSYLLFETDSTIQEVKLGSDIPSSVTYIEPFVFVPMHLKAKGNFASSNWVYYADTHRNRVGKFRVAEFPRQVLEYEDLFVVLSGSDGVHVQFYDRNFRLVREISLGQDVGYLQMGSLILGDSLFLGVGGQLMQVDLTGKLAPQNVALPGQWGWVSLAEWRGKLVASDRKTLWLINPTTMAIEHAFDFPFERKGEGLSVVLEDSMLVLDTETTDAVLVNFSSMDLRRVRLDRLPTHVSLIGEEIYVSHHDGMTVLDKEGNIISTRSINGRFLSNFVKPF